MTKSSHLEQVKKGIPAPLLKKSVHFHISGQMSALTSAQLNLRTYMPNLCIYYLLISALKAIFANQV